MLLITLTPASNILLFIVSLKMKEQLWQQKIKINK